MTIGDDGIASRDNMGASFQKRPHWLKYKPCNVYAARKFHDWRWPGWPLSFNAVSGDEKWCNECWLLKRMVNGRWAEAGYREPIEASCDCGNVQQEAAPPPMVLCSCKSNPNVKYVSNKKYWMVLCPNEVCGQWEVGLTAQNAIDIWNIKHLEVEPYPFGKVDNHD
jgi:hypothetical protein